MVPSYSHIFQWLKPQPAFDTGHRELPNGLSQSGGQTDRQTDTGEIFKLCNVQPIQKTN